MDLTGPIHVCVIDDDPKLREIVVFGLREAGLECTEAAGASEALQLLAKGGSPRFDLILLDIMMPEMSGWEFLAALRERGIGTPVLFVTARESVEERVRGLKLGADDYIIKPFVFAELLARIEAVLRRRRRERRHAFGGLELDIERRTVRCDGRRIDLTPIEFNLLRVLVEHRGGTVSRRDLLRDVWQSDHDPGTNVLEVHIARLRRRLSPFDATHIETVRGQGYRLSDGGEGEA
jgi:DNA-binding response OmpR family regulator